MRYPSQHVRDNFGATSPGEGLILQGGDRLVTRWQPGSADRVRAGGERVVALGADRAGERAAQVLAAP